MKTGYGARWTEAEAHDSGKTSGEDRNSPQRGGGARWDTAGPGGDSWTEAESQRGTTKTSGEEFNPPPRVRAAAAVDAGQ